ncbi:Peptidoglycan/xylan/chitin deacetylase, PgdA/CDA1 family [Oceanobacillus limi]|uniref:Peptidoglycan/xylan/chitin deacetylase, PgdA/CDA1 family n=1 Tax=Oceanobacillus limi TaxID=930131 RepID=A0A1I0F8R1_9BACI|nr:polysaccharide deacetylase family protein [Oceanobacillus limi]SET54471.1 Peptidoglycan/xylan/chitin deacetylase, PgdA/CDA1 family [Oceanobacillus limi]
MRGNLLTLFACISFVFFTVSPYEAQQEELPEPEGGSELTERVRQPISNIVLQQRYPESIVLSGNQADTKIALTFDDGPDPRFTPEILDVLKANDIQATFFLMGARAKAYPELVARIIEEGHIIGNHTYWHPNLVEQADIATLEREVNHTEETLAELSGYRTKLFRAPYGFLYNDLVEKLAEMDYTIVGWSVDSLDWQETPPEVIASNVIGNIHPGAIILMHDGAEWDGDRTNTILSLQQIIPELIGQGYRFTTIPDLLNIPYQK